MARLFYHTSDLDVEVNLNISRNRNKAVPAVNGPVPHHDDFGSGEPTMMADLYRMMGENFDSHLIRIKSRLDLQHKKLVKLTQNMRATNQRLADLQHGAQQPRFAMEADVK